MIDFPLNILGFLQNHLKVILENIVKILKYIHIFIFFSVFEYIKLYHNWHLVQ